MCAGLVAIGAWAEPSLEHIGTFVWDRPEDYFGGWSAIEVRAGGLEFVAIADGAQTYDGVFARTDGVISGVVWAPVGALADTDGVEFFRKGIEGRQDSEGVALFEGGIAVSFERDHRIVIYRDGASPVDLALPREVHSVGENGGVEALAVDLEGRLIAIPETRPAGAEAFPVWRQVPGGWETVGQIAPSDGFAPVGADVAPDGRLFVLERAFRGVGFRSRVRVFGLDQWSPDGTTLWTTGTRAFDNLEGISVWRADDGLRVTMIADDNYRWFQRTEIVEFRLTE